MAHMLLGAEMCAEFQGLCTLSDVLMWIAGMRILIGILFQTIDIGGLFSLDIDDIVRQRRALRLAHDQARTAMYQVAERIALLDMAQLSPEAQHQYETIAVAFAELLQGKEDPRIDGLPVATYTTVATQCQVWLQQLETA